jgi:hypothetical protein
MDDLIFAEVAALEKRLGLVEGFYDQLVKNDDWSFVVKLNALFEAACTQALIVRLSCPELTDNLAHLDFADNKKGKVRLCFNIGIINDEQRLALNELAELRNSLVHKIENVDFSFDKYVRGLSEGKKTTLVKRWGWSFSDTLSFHGTTVSKTSFIFENLKTVIWLTCADILACLHVEFENAIWRERLRDMAGYHAICAVDRKAAADVKAPSVNQVEEAENFPSGLLGRFLKMGGNV